MSLYVTSLPPGSLCLSEWHDPGPLAHPHSSFSLSQQNQSLRESHKRCLLSSSWICPLLSSYCLYNFRLFLTRSLPFPTYIPLALNFPNV